MIQKKNHIDFMSKIRPPLRKRALTTILTRTPTKIPAPTFTLAQSSRGIEYQSPSSSPIPSPPPLETQEEIPESKSDFQLESFSDDPLLVKYDDPKESPEPPPERKKRSKSVPTLWDPYKSVVPMEKVHLVYAIMPDEDNLEFLTILAKEFKSIVVEIDQSFEHTQNLSVFLSECALKGVTVEHIYILLGPFVNVKGVEMIVQAVFDTAILARVGSVVRVMDPFFIRDINRFEIELVGNVRVRDAVIRSFGPDLIMPLNCFNVIDRMTVLKYIGANLLF
jgi:hypothetical protein